jgi:ATP-dependent RNA helicase DDX60
MILRLFNLLEGSNDAPYAVEAIRSILRLQHISFGSDVGKTQFLHHLRFCIDYLRRAHLLNQEGKPINLLEIASHLYYTEPSNLAMTVLLQSGVVHDICSQTSLINARRDLMILLCHLFGRRYLPWIYVTNNIYDFVQRGPSRVVLPPLHPAARRVLAAHQKEILGTFGAYALAFSSRCADELGPDNQLPLSGRVIGTSDASTRPETAFFSQLAKTATQPKARSIFVANSGHNDTFGGVEELVRTVRHGVHLNEHAIPTIERILNPKLPLNAYLYDFFIHGQDDALVNMNGIRRGELWYALDTFHHVLTTIRGDLENLLLRMSKDAALHQGETDDAAGMSEDSGYHTFDSTEREEDEADPAAFNRPGGVSDRDWRVYEVVNSITNEFGAKFKAMWA